MGVFEVGFCLGRLSGLTEFYMSGDFSRTLSDVIINVKTSQSDTHCFQCRCPSWSIWWCALTISGIPILTSLMNSEDSIFLKPGEKKYLLLPQLVSWSGLVIVGIWFRESCSSQTKCITKRGFSTGLELNMLRVVASTSLDLYCWIANRRRGARKENEKLDNSSEVLGDLGDNHPDFRYIL
jgi:hypothetical protein